MARKQGTAIVKHSEVKEVVEKPGLLPQALDSQKTIDSLKGMNLTAVIKSGKSPEELLKEAKEKFNRLNPFKKDKSSELEKYQKQKSHPNADSLFKRPSFSVYYELAKSGNLIFDITCPGLLPVMQVDVNGNGEEDGCIDRIYKKDDMKNEFNALFVADKTAAAQTSTCPGAASAATFLIAGDRYLFCISPEELSSIEKKGFVNFVFYSSNKKEVIYYPQPSSDKLFEKTLEVTF